MKGKEKGVRSRQTAHAKARGHVNPEDILANYRTGTRWAAWAFIGMFAFMSFGAVFLGW